MCFNLPSNWTEGEKLLRYGQQRYPDDLWFNLELARGLLRHGGDRAVEALEYYRTALGLRPRSALVWKSLGVALSQTRRFAEAEAAFRRSNELQANLPDTYFRLADVLVAQNRQPEAVTALNRCIELDPYDGPTYTRLADVLMQQARQADAINTVRRFAAIRPNDAGTHLQCGRWFDRWGRADEAVAAYRRAAVCDPNFTGVDEALGKSLAKQGQFADSLAAYRRVKEKYTKSPDCPDAYKSLTAQWVRDAEQRLELDAKLARVLDGDVEPVNASEQLALAQFCLEWKKFAAMAARLFAAAFVESPTYADPPALHRYNAARAAALAGCGQGKDVANLDYTERIRLRKQALEWLTADLAARAKLAELPAERLNARQTIQHWQEDTDLAGVRRGCHRQSAEGRAGRMAKALGRRGGAGETVQGTADAAVAAEGVTTYAGP